MENQSNIKKLIAALNAAGIVILSNTNSADLRELFNANKELVEAAFRNMHHQDRIEVQPMKYPKRLKDIMIDEQERKLWEIDNDIILEEIVDAEKMKPRRSARIASNILKNDIYINEAYEIYEKSIQAQIDKM